MFKSGISHSGKQFGYGEFQSPVRLDEWDCLPYYLEITDNKVKRDMELSICGRDDNCCDWWIPDEKVLSEGICTWGFNIKECKEEEHNVGTDDEAMHYAYVLLTIFSYKSNQKVDQVYFITFVKWWLEILMMPKEIKIMNFCFSSVAHVLTSHVRITV